MPAPQWFTENLGWKDASKKTTARCMRYFGEPIGPNLADLSGASSTRIAGEAYRILGIPQSRRTDFDIGAVEREKDPQSDDGSSQPTVRSTAAGTRLERGLQDDIERNLQAIDPNRTWSVTRRGKVDQYAQYEHLRRLQDLFDGDDPTLKSTVGRDYLVSTDVMVGLPNPWSDGPHLALHAAVSSKLTIRSDRVQNIRFEFGSLVRNRKGRLPHLVVVTAEPLPSRLVSIARGTGEIDAVYHLLFHELEAALDGLEGEHKSLRSQWSDWRELVDTRRIRPYSELAEVLATS